MKCEKCAAEIKTGNVNATPIWSWVNANVACAAPVTAFLWAGTYEWKAPMVAAGGVPQSFPIVVKL